MFRGLLSFLDASPPIRHYVIESTSPLFEWQEAFMQEAIEKGIDPSKIIHFGDCLKQCNENRQEADRMFTDWLEKANVVILPLIECGSYKHFLKCIAEFSLRLESDLRTIVVYDLSNVPKGDSGSGAERAVNEMAYNALIWFLQETFGKNRIRSREDAIWMTVHGNAAAA